MSNAQSQLEIMYSLDGHHCEGTLEQLAHAGIISADQDLPRRPGGSIEREGKLKITMGKNGLLRVWGKNDSTYPWLDAQGRTAFAAWLRADLDFQGFMVRVLAATSSRRSDGGAAARRRPGKSSR